MKVGKFLVGLGVGAVIGMLLAPKKGSELREDIVKESKKAYDSVKNLTKEDVEAMLGETIETVKKTVDEFDLEQFKSSASDKLSDLEFKLQEFATKVKESDQYMQVKDSIVELTEKVNSKIDEVKNKAKESELTNSDLESLEVEIVEVEEKLEDIIEEIQE